MSRFSSLFIVSAISVLSASNASAQVCNPLFPTDACVIIKVTSNLDSHDVQPGNGICADRAGNCTLRAALEEANALAQNATEPTIHQIQFKRPSQYWKYFMK